jgi:hypothetical protein
METTFNPDPNAKEVQLGVIVYRFTNNL